MQEEIRNKHTVFLEILKGTDLLENSCKRKDNIKMDIKETECVWNGFNGLRIGCKFGHL
jgi:hypothetical protein